MILWAIALRHRGLTLTPPEPVSRPGVSGWPLHALAVSADLHLLMSKNQRA